MVYLHAFSGTDGVSLETEKWAMSSKKADLPAFISAANLIVRPSAPFWLKKLISSTRTLGYFSELFRCQDKKPRGNPKNPSSQAEIKDQLYKFIEKFNLDLLVPENALTIPLNIPLGIAITELISETGMPTIAHHHDFFWERQHFMINACWEYLNMAFPPHLPWIQHVVINSSADNQLSLRTGISARIIPNVMDFDHPPPVTDVLNHAH